MDRITVAEKLPDRSGKPGEALCFGFVPDLQWIAGTIAD